MLFKQSISTSLEYFVFIKDSIEIYHANISERYKYERQSSITGENTKIQHRLFSYRGPKIEVYLIDKISTKQLCSIFTFQYLERS